MDGSSENMYLKISILVIKLNFNSGSRHMTSGTQFIVT